RTGVYCHDLDTFRCLLNPKQEPRPQWFRALVRRTLRGLQAARWVFHNSQLTRQEILAHGLIDPARLIHAPLGVSPEFTPDDSRPVPRRMVHVGSTIPRKRADVLLRVLAALRQIDPTWHLVKVGGSWTPEHQALIAEHQLHAAIDHRHDLTRTELAAVYCSAERVVVPSDAEGFGLPVIEGLACGAAVVASDIPVLREVGAAAVQYAPVGDIPAWVQTILTPAPPKDQRLSHAAQFTWAAHARIIAEIYAGV
ncbi:MAG: glycosyltransferase, partial [Gemmataceae bacterium]